MAPPKRKPSLSRTKRRIRSHRRPMPGVASCPQCGAAKQPHRICSTCGSYKGRQVVSVTVEE